MVFPHDQRSTIRLLKGKIKMITVEKILDEIQRRRNEIEKERAVRMATPESYLNVERGHSYGREHSLLELAIFIQENQ